MSDITVHRRSLRAQHTKRPTSHIRAINGENVSFNRKALFALRGPSFTSLFTY